MITMFLRFMVTVESMLRPAAATMPNITITPPPSTGRGMEAITAPILRQETAHDKDDGADRDNVPAHDSGHADDPDILAERRIGKAAEDGCSAVPRPSA